MEKNLGCAIKKRRLFMYLTPEDLAERLHVDTDTIEDWENNRSCPDMYVIPELCEELGSFMWDLFHVENKSRVYSCKTAESPKIVKIKDARINEKAEFSIPLNVLEIMLQKGAVNQKSSLKNIDWQRVLEIGKAGLAGRILDEGQSGVTIDIEEI